MAIIYTYPPLTNPQGNELIVVSDVNNKNATRLITIADIASLVPGGGGGGCATAITGILNSTGNPLYTAAACSEMELVSSNGSVVISSTATGINLEAATELRCASKEELGGVRITNSFQIDTIPEPITEDFTIYPIETSDDESEIACTAVVRIPNAQSSGGTVTSVAAAVQGDAYTATVSNPTTNASINIAANGASTDYINGEGNLTAFPSINDGTLTITVDGTASTFTANQAGNTNVSITTGGGSGSTDNGFTPLSIYDGKSGQGAGEEETLWCQTVVEDACVINKVDYGAIGGNSQNLTVALYKGTLGTAAGSSATLIGWGEITTTSVGINTIALSDDGTSSGNDIVIEAGDDIVIAWSKPSSVGGLLGKGGADTPVQFWLGQRIAGASFTASDLTLGESISTTQSNLSENPASNADVYRLSWHFYKGETSQEVERFAYLKCDNVNNEGACLNMPAEVIIEAEASALLDYLIIEDTANKDVSCCYFKTTSTTNPITNNMAIIGTFTNCEVDNLPVSCTEG